MNSSECNNIDTRKELAKIAGVGVEKYYRTNKILKTDNEEIKEKLKNGDISVNKAVASPMKMAKCIQELERIKGIRKGSAGKVSLGGNKHTNKETITQKDLANELNISRQQLRNYKQLNDLIPDLQTMVENGSMKATVGYKIWAKMSEEEQEKFFNDIGIVLKPY
ncbi:Uncharacterised protein [Clostridium butyricum]|uniref:ParB/Spo0J HTH domain-containing protein n=1 Tax=Clostridium butyricum TaxID=1492 RepID=A0A6N3FF37_CLOBU